MYVIDQNFEPQDFKMSHFFQHNLYLLIQYLMGCH